MELEKILKREKQSVALETNTIKKKNSSNNIVEGIFFFFFFLCSCISTNLLYRAFFTIIPCGDAFKVNVSPIAT